MNIRENPSLDSKIIGSVMLGESVVALNTKFDNTNDFLITNLLNSIDSLLVGSWLRIMHNGQIAHVFDCYLFRHNFKKITDLEYCTEIDSIQKPNENSIIRCTKHKGVIAEQASGVQWASKSFLIPDISLQEAVLFLKAEFPFTSSSHWKVADPENEVIVHETNEILFWNASIKRIGEYIFISIHETM